MVFLLKYENMTDHQSFFHTDQNIPSLLISPGAAGVGAVASGGEVRLGEVAVARGSRHRGDGGRLKIINMKSSITRRFKMI